MVREIIDASVPAFGSALAPPPPAALAGRPQHGERTEPPSFVSRLDDLFITPKRAFPIDCGNYSRSLTPAHVPKFTDFKRGVPRRYLRRAPFLMTYEKQQYSQLNLARVRSEQASARRATHRSTTVTASLTARDLSQSSEGPHHMALSWSTYLTRLTFPHLCAEVPATVVRRYSSTVY